VILFKNIESAPQAARALRITAPELKELAVIDQIVAEPPGGAHTDGATMAMTVKSAIVEQLRELLRLNPEQLVEQRYLRYRRFGAGPAKEKGD
jgi:acetyl-CoA carboxylase carboxyl transferase subunit alpha